LWVGEEWGGRGEGEKVGGGGELAVKNGAMTLSVMTLSVATRPMKGLFVTLGINDTQQNDTVLSIVMLSVTMLCVIMPSVIFHLLLC
jgi:hypothetical protein